MVVVSGTDDLGEPEELVEPSVSEGSSVRVQDDHSPAHPLRDQIGMAEGDVSAQIRNALLCKDGVEAT